MKKFVTDDNEKKLKKIKLTTADIESAFGAKVTCSTKGMDIIQLKYLMEKILK